MKRSSWSVYKKANDSRLISGNLQYWKGMSLVLVTAWSVYARYIESLPKLIFLYLHHFKLSSVAAGYRNLAGGIDLEVRYELGLARGGVHKGVRAPRGECSDTSIREVRHEHKFRIRMICHN